MGQNVQLENSLIRVLVVAHSVVMQAGLEALLATDPTLEVVGSLADIRHLQSQVEHLQPDVVLLEWQESDLEWIVALSGEVTGEELPTTTGPGVVLLLEDWQPATIADLLRSGVHGILPDETTASEIIGALQAVALGLTVLHPDIATSLRLFLPPASPTNTDAINGISTTSLTPREIEVLQMLAEGLGNKAIARRLTISEHTVKFHIGSIFSKLNASSRTEAVILGARQGLILL